jgi:formamidopyrimidine-DNA glycosylase
VPELPEVEVTRRSIAPAVQAARIEAVRLGKPLRWPLGVAPHQLLGLRMAADDANGAAAGGLLMHLGMSGSLAFVPLAPQDVPPAPGPHDHVDLRLSSGLLRLTDPRRFGAVVWSAALDEDPAAKLLQRLGAEPFDAVLDGGAFHRALKQRRSPIKAVLLGGEVIVGAGNIYACEALFQAGIDPRLRADRISKERALLLLQAVRRTLARAMDLGGSTLRDFRDAHGMDGAYQSEAVVYGRAGQPCLRCTAPVQRIVQAQRATYFCRHCQRR